MKTLREAAAAHAECLEIALSDNATARPLAECPESIHEAPMAPAMDGGGFIGLAGYSVVDAYRQLTGIYDCGEFAAAVADELNERRKTHDVGHAYVVELQPVEIL